MSTSDEQVPLILSRVEGKEKNRLTIQNTYFKGAGSRNTQYLELSILGKKFLLNLVSYELNFTPKKIDYYYLGAKKLQTLFHIPGWILLLPTTNYLTKNHFRTKIIAQANEFNSEMIHEIVRISTFQAHALNKAYKNFLWE